MCIFEKILLNIGNHQHLDPNLGIFEKFFITLHFSISWFISLKKN